MTEETATRVANVILITAAAAAAWFVLRDPARRRAAFQAARAFVTGPLPGFLARELRTAWEASGQRSIIAR